MMNNIENRRMVHSDATIALPTEHYFLILIYLTWLLSARSPPIKSLGVSLKGQLTPIWVLAEITGRKQLTHHQKKGLRFDHLSIERISGDQNF